MRSLIALVIVGCISGCSCAEDGAPDAGAPDGGSDVDAAARVCPTYQALCGGQCILVAVDPDNCGACGVVCAADRACSAGACSSACLPGQTACDRACVDLMTDNRHCGACGAPCAAGTGCVEGQCQTNVIGSETHADCTGGGPVLFIDFNGQTCSRSLATTTFRWALCSCTDAVLSGSLLTDAYDSARRPYTPGGLGGGVGLDGQYRTSGTTDISGAFWASSEMGVDPSNVFTVHMDARMGGPFGPRTSIVGGDAYVNGNVSTIASIAIAGDLHQSPGFAVSGNVTYANLIAEPVSVPPPCDCRSEVLIPVTAIASARSTNNDNARIGLDPTALLNPSGATRVDLPCGHYYVDGLSGGSAITIVAHGQVALYVGGDVQLSHALRIAVDPGGSLDVFIGGDFNDSGSVSIGSPNYPALTRFYSGSANGLSVSSGSLLGAFFYAPFGQVSSVAALDVFGGIFAGDFQSSANVAIHYDRAVLRLGDDCGQPSPGCGSCTDCNNQACVGGTCGACTDSSQCCAPLICTDGRCVASSI